MEKRKIGKLFTFKDYGHTCALFSGIEGETSSFDGFYRYRKDGDKFSHDGKLANAYGVNWDDNDGGCAGLFEGDITFVRDFVRAMRERRGWGEIIGEPNETYVWFKVEGENITVYSGGDGSMYYFEHYTTEQWDIIVDEMENAVDYLESLTD